MKRLIVVAGSVDPMSVVAPTTVTRSLESRLHDGYQRIEQAVAKGEDVTAWEDFWIDLLHQYESELAPLMDAA